MNITSTIIINKPLKTVWDFYDDPENLKLWLTNFKSFETISGTHGTAGAKAKHTYVERGRELFMFEELTARIPYQKLSGILTMPKMMTSLMDTTFVEKDGATVITCVTETKFEFISLKLFGFLLKKGFQKRQDSHFEKLKMEIEKLAV